MDKRAIIIGAGSIGREIARRFTSRYQVLLVDTTIRRDENSPPEIALEDLPELEMETGIWQCQADGSSRLVLKALYTDAVQCSLIVVTDSDERNLEICSLAREFDFRPIIVNQLDPKNSERFKAEHLSTINGIKILADHVEMAMGHQGAIVPSNIGLGKGELIEVELVKTSPVLRRPLKELAPHTWRIAAIFRKDRLIVPMGDTTLDVGDKVLLVGDPGILPTVAEYFRLGTPQFPQPYGSNIITLEYFEDDQLTREAEYLACSSGAPFLVRGIPESNLDEEVMDYDLRIFPMCRGEAQTAVFHLYPADQPEFKESIRQHQPGTLVLKAEDRSFLEKILGIRGGDSHLCDSFPVPIIFSRGTFPYKKILFPISGSYLDVLGAELAIDLTRMLDAHLTIMNVDLPEHISGINEEDLHEELPKVEQLCQLYDVHFDYVHREDNPVAAVLDEASRHDLLVLSRWRGRRDTYFNPDVALRLCRKALCSTMVMTRTRDRVIL